MFSSFASHITFIIQKGIFEAACVIYTPLFLCEARNSEYDWSICHYYNFCYCFICLSENVVSYFQYISFIDDLLSSIMSKPVPAAPLDEVVCLH